MKQKRGTPAIFGDRLRKLRNERGLTMEQFCDQYNARTGSRLNKSTVSRYENGTQEPMLNTVASFADFFGVSPTYLIGDGNRGGMAANISNSAVVQGNNATTLIVKNGAVHKEALSDQTVELIHIFTALDVKRQTQLLTRAFELEDEMKAEKNKPRR